MVGEVFENLLLQLLFTVGLIAAFGLVIWLLNRVFYKLAGDYGKVACILTGFIGTPVHEAGHAIFCVLFGHKVVEMKLYQPNSKDGVLGYVSHTYNKKNVYHQIGNFFIGLGPIILGSGVLLLLMFLLVPDLLGELSDTMNLLALLNLDLFSFSTIGYIFEILWEIVTTFFGTASLTDPLWWLFMIPACSIALHMSLSASDIKGSAIGFIFIVSALLITNIILYFVNIDAMLAMTDWSLRISGFILNFLMISILLSLILVFIGGIFKGASKLIKLKK